jgi:hypothetical protein
VSLEPTRRTGAAAVLVLVMVGTLGGCTSETDRYCASLEEQQEPLQELAASADDPGADLYRDLLDIWRGLRADAPDDIRDEWTTLVFSMETFVEAVERTGVTPDELDPEDPPPGATETDVAAAVDAAEDLRSERVLSAGEAVQQHARDVCKTDLGLTGGTGG